MFTRTMNCLSLARGRHTCTLTSHFVRHFQTVEVNGRKYSVPDSGMRAVVCVDGFDPEYLESASAAGAIPCLSALPTQRIVDCAMPSFTNPNNISIISGVPPSVHGISGNFFYDPKQKEEVMMNDPKYINADSILNTLAHHGHIVLSVTTKDKLRRILTGKSKHPRVLSMSVEHARDEFQNSEASEWEDFIKGEMKIPFNSISDELLPSPLPGIYDPLASISCVEAGVRFARKCRDMGVSAPVTMYLSTTDYVQHKHGPHDPNAIAFMKKLDSTVEELCRLGVDVVVTADHGMSWKSDLSTGQPKVVYLEDTLRQSGIQARVLLPITDPYVVHHGALGGYACIYVSGGKLDIMRARDVITSAHGSEVCVYDRERAASKFDLPADRIGDLVVVGEQEWALGKSRRYHDLSQVAFLRTHGSVYEQKVPFLSSISSDCDDAKEFPTKNFDAFSFLLGDSRSPSM